MYGSSSRIVYNITLPIEEEEIQAHENFCEYLSKLVTDAKDKKVISDKAVTERMTKVTARRKNKKSEPVDELPMALTD